MANPFIVFRKHQKLILALLGVLCMVSFVFLPIVSDYLNTNGSGADAVVVTTAYGDVTERRLDQMQQNRARMNGFAIELMALAQGYRIQYEIFGPATERDVVDGYVQARRAEAMGLVVSDNAVNDFLKQLTMGRVSDEDLRNLMARFEMTERELISGLREQLLATQLQRVMLGHFVDGMPPGPRWNYYQRLNRRVSAEVIPVHVADYTKNVPDPDEATLAAFYEEHKNRYYVPGSAEPGFHRPDRARFEYLKAEYQAFLKPETISEADVAAHYEKYKDTRYLYTDTPWAMDRGSMPEATSPTSTTPSTPAEPTGSAPAGEAPAETPATNSPDAPAPAPNAGAGEGDESNTTAAGESPDAPVVPTGEVPPAPAAAPETAPEATPPGGGGDDAAGSSAAPATAESAPSDTTSESAATEAAASNDEAATSGGPTLGDAPSGAASGTSAASNATADAAAMVGDDLVLPTDLNAGPAPKYDPLWKVEGRIREELAREQASKLMQDTLRKVQKILQSYSLNRDGWRAKRPQDPEPPRPDFNELAAQNGLSADRTELISAVELQQSTDLGKATVPGSESFAEFAFHTFRPFDTIIAQDQNGNQYLVWKIEEQADHVPKLTEIRDQVMLAWKMQKARELARQQAEELAAQARKSGEKSLGELFAGQGYRVLNTGPFSWLTYGAAVQFAPESPPRLSEVPGVVDAGPDFMQTVFAAQPNDVVVALNNPQTTAYVVRVGAVEPSDSFLQATFLSDDYQRYASAGAPDYERMRQRWRTQLEAEASLVWQRPAADATARR